MTAKIELLPLPGWAEVTGNKVQQENIRDYARANVLHHTAAQAAEIEALRAERDRAVEAGEIMARHLDTLEARSERLAEAGRRVTAAFRALGDSSCITAAAIKRRECEAAMTAFDALLRDQEEQ